MNIYKLMPKTRKPILLIALMLLICVCGLLFASLAKYAITTHSIIPFVFSLIPLCLSIGLWRLNTITRNLALILLWLLLLGSAINPWNPIYYIEFKEKYHRIPDLYESILKSIPEFVISAYCIYALIKYKFEFGTKQTNIVEAPEVILPK